MRRPPCWFIPVLLLLVSPLRGENLLSPVDKASTDPNAASPWRTYTWEGDGRFAVVEGGRHGGKCLELEADAPGGNISWIQDLQLDPDSDYRLVAWIKTEDLQASTGRGVVVHLDGDERLTKEFSGTNDWTRVEAVVRPVRGDVAVHCSLGGWGLAAGRVWIDDLSLEKIPAVGAPIEVTIDAGKPGAPINPFIYGQFIEHLGRCIYGGIWAEMLEDRKFFFPITDEYDPYRPAQGNLFPVVDASPWEVLGPAGSVEMSTAGSFVGAHTPLVAPDSGIRQNDLGLVAGRDYVGHVWLKSPQGEAIVSISLVWGDGENERQTLQVSVAGAEYQRFPLRFTSQGSTDESRLEIRVAGAPCFLGTLSLMPADNVRGFRADTLALLKELGATMYRWPGGNFVSGYDWRDGIGPRDHRPPRKNPAWTGVEHNDVGIDEFVDFCREVGAEPIVAVNTGFGDAYSAAQEVEYCNGSADTIGGSWRAGNGHPEPYGVRYWCVGNEMWGAWQHGFMKLRHYTQKHNLVADAMRRVDPNVVLVASGDLDTRNRPDDPGEQRGWSEGMLQECADHMDLISEHFYRGRVPWTSENEIPVSKHVGMLRESIRQKANGHRELQKKLFASEQASSATAQGEGPRIVPIAMDEWNFWHRNYYYGELGCRYDLTDALGIAAGLHEYFRNSDIIQMAHYAQTVNVIGCVKTTKTDAFLSTTALPLLLYSHQFGTVPLAVSGNFDEESLDVAAARTEDGSALTIGIVNPNESEQTLHLKVVGATVGRTATVWRIAGDDPTAFNTVDNQPVTIDEERDVPLGDELTVPPYSVSLYRVSME